MERCIVCDDCWRNDGFHRRLIYFCCLQLYTWCIVLCGVHVHSWHSEDGILCGVVAWCPADGQCRAPSVGAPPSIGAMGECIGSSDGAMLWMALNRVGSRADFWLWADW